MPFAKWRSFRLGLNVLNSRQQQQSDIVNDHASMENKTRYDVTGYNSVEQ